jgi:hypothetical protein
VSVELPELEQRLSNLQTQVERLWRKAEANVPPIEQRLAAMADQYADYLKRWAETVERHTQAVAQLESYASEWKDASSRVRLEANERLQDLEATIAREWDDLKRMQEEPIRELREQAESLQQASLAMANASLRGVERAETRFATFENDVHLRLAELTRDLQTALTEMRLRLDRPPAGRDLSATWSLDDVTRLHGQLREGVGATGDFPHTIDHPSISSIRELSAASAPDAAGAEIYGFPPKWVAAAAALVIAVLTAGIFGYRLQSQIKSATERARISELKADAAINDAARQQEAALESARQLAEMREMTLRAQRMAEVTAAPDLIRFNLSGTKGASGQGLFSRSRGLVINGWRLPELQGNSTYQAWLVTRTMPIKAGALMPQGDGSATLVQQPPTVPRAVVGIIVSAESASAGDTPSGATVLSSIAPPAEEP